MRDLKTSFNLSGYNSEEVYFHRANRELIERIRERKLETNGDTSPVEVPPMAREGPTAKVIPLRPRSQPKVSKRPARAA